jgi:mannose-1-phosphate guanylyltransferase
LKAFLLAAGLGTRLRPFTDHLPKCLVPIGGKPLLQLWLELFAKHGVEKVLVNTHHLPEHVDDFARSWIGPPQLRLVHEDTLLGSGGTLHENWSFCSGDGNVLVCYADNLTDIDLAALVRYHCSHNGLVTMALFHTDNPRECGIATLGKNGVVTAFNEKPRHPESSLANCGVYVMRREVFSLLPAHRPADIAFDVLPRCVGRMYGWLWDGLFIDVGSPAAYERAQSAWSRLQASHTTS